MKDCGYKMILHRKVPDVQIYNSRSKYPTDDVSGALTG
jgi:hypothetical protein